MSEPDPAWEKRSQDLWATLDDHDEEKFLALIEALVSELPAGSPIALFERGAAYDSTGHSDRAVPLYQEALEAGLSGERRRRAVIQMASSLRNLREAQRAVDLLSTELAQDTTRSRVRSAASSRWR